MNACGILELVEWSQELVDRLDLAFNESQVCGMTLDIEKAELRLLVEVLALPEVGAIDPDPRRVAVFCGVSLMQVTLESDSVRQPRPALPLESVVALDRFFESLTRAEAMYGWSFFDRADLDETRTPSLVQRTDRPDAGHSFLWFTECARDISETESEAYAIEGVIQFEELRVERADGLLLSLDDFWADARRWWDALEGHDERVSVEAQSQAGRTAARWRAWGGISTVISGGTT